MILVDTSVWIDFFRGAETFHRHKLHELIEQEGDLCLTALNLSELLQGTAGDEEFARLRSFLKPFPVIVLDDVETYVHAARIFSKCKRTGMTVRNTVDCLIAAVAIEHGLVLFHKDRDFDKIASTTSLKVLAL